jgi:hypothetical protein
MRLVATDSLKPHEIDTPHAMGIITLKRVLPIARPEDNPLFLFKTTENSFPGI